MVTELVLYDQGLFPLLQITLSSGEGLLQAKLQICNMQVIFLLWFEELLDKLISILPASSPDREV